ncbi:MAG: DUF4159 domain-containing protein [Acidobacteriota bacterium]
MRLRTVFFFIFAGVATLGLIHAQKPFHDYVGDPGVSTEYAPGQVPLPPDWGEPAEWSRGRLKYTSSGMVHPPAFNTGWMGWATDYPKGDRHFQEGLRRLTLINASSVEHVAELDGSDDIFNWPFMYAVEVGHWHLFQDEADQLREYLLRGGFLMTDDFHGTLEWENFLKSLYKVFATRPIVDIDNTNEVFHVLYDLEHRTQIPGKQFLQSRKPYEFDGFEPKWRAIFDGQGRIMIAICHNMDISDAIENSDDPEYPEEWANLAYRLSTNYVVYDLTH